MSKALLIIDIQNDYFKGGAMELHGSEEASIAAKSIIEKFRADSRLIVFMQHIGNSNSSFFKPNTIGVEIHNSVLPLDNELIITKHFPNSFRDTNLLATLKTQNIKELIICGMMTHMCVDTTVRAAHDLGFDNIVIDDACATKTQEFRSDIVTPVNVQTAYMAAIDGTFAQVINSHDYLNP